MSNNTLEMTFQHTLFCFIDDIMNRFNPRKIKVTNFCDATHKKAPKNRNIALKHKHVSLWVFVCYFPGPSPNIEIINPGFNAKEMSTYEIIHNHYPEENLYSDISTLDIAKVHENGAYYDTAEPLEDKNMYLRMLDASGEGMQRTSHYLSTSHTKQPSEGRLSNTKDGQPNYYVDSTYLMPRPSVKKQ